MIQNRRLTSKEVNFNKFCEVLDYHFATWILKLYIRHWHFYTKVDGPVRKEREREEHAYQRQLRQQFPEERQECFITEAPF